MPTGNPPERRNGEAQCRTTSGLSRQCGEIGRARSRSRRAGARRAAEAASLKDQLLRALAETENTRRRAQREREDSARYAAAPLAKDIVPVADNLARALAAVPREALAQDEALRNLVEGIAATERQLQAALERHNIKRIDPMGEKFDSHLHQAMFEVPSHGQARRHRRPGAAAGLYPA